MQTTLLRHADFRRLWAADALSQTGTQVTAIALPLLLIKVLDAGPFEVGLLTTFEFLAFLLIGLPAGVWVDRMRRRNVLMVADLVRGAAVRVAAAGLGARRAHPGPGVRGGAGGRRVHGVLRRGVPVVPAAPGRAGEPGRGQRQAAGHPVGRAGGRADRGRRAGAGADRAVRDPRRRGVLPLVGGLGRVDPVPRAAAGAGAGPAPRPGDEGGPGLRPRQPAAAGDHRVHRRRPTCSTTSG